MQIIKLEDPKVNITIIMSLKYAKIEDFLNLPSAPQRFSSGKRKTRQS